MLKTSAKIRFGIVILFKGQVGVWSPIFTIFFLVDQSFSSIMLNVQQKGRSIGILYTQRINHV